MRLGDYILPAGFLPLLECRDYEDAVDRLVAALGVDDPNLDRKHLATEILRREKAVSTAIGGGLAIPHLRSAQVERLSVALATLRHPLVIPAEDDQPVDIIILMVGPGRDPRQMLRALSRLARLVRNPGFPMALRRAKTAADLAAALLAAEEKILGRAQP